MKCFSRFTNDESDPIIIENEETDSECEKDHSKGKMQHKGKKNKEADEGKRSGKKLESVKKGKEKEKVEEGLQLKVDSRKKRKEPEQGQGQGERKITDCKKRKTSTSVTMQKHIPFTGKKLLLRYILNDGANEYKLTTSLINEIFGIPNGETQVTQMSKPKTYDPVVKEWRSQFDDEMQKKQKKISVSDLVEYLKKTDDSERMFKLNFMVLLMSIIGETMKSNTVNLRFLTSLKTNTDFKKLDWCEYVLECLRRTRKGWGGKEGEIFTGPIMLLVVRIERIEKELKKVEEHAEKLKMLFEKERKDYPSKTPRIQSKDTVLLDTPLIVSQDTMSELIELEKQATKKIEEVENQKKKSELVNKNDPPGFRLLSQDSNEGNPEIEIGNTENVEKETVGEKEIVEEMVREKPVGGTEKIGEELVVEKNVEKEMVVEKIVGEETKEDEINEDTMEAEGDKMCEEKTPAEVEEKKQERPKRKIILSDALCSPYKQRRAGIEEKLTTVEKNISSYLFYGNGYVWDSLFEITDVMTTPKLELETLSPGIEVHVDVINTWAHLLNNEELKRNRELCFQAVLYSSYDYFAHPKTDEMDDTVVKRFEMPWRTTVNNKDCGIFMMRHMETYMGEEEKAWHCGFEVE
ncbi:hypothetical protein L1987_36569 [Smallanthus sonchifolius]|uniref:Uncharacterized protein n=1 Tax=Smallanthus sonchifolius TaxID=185202 RepID=A0ACB9HFA5_9ASTR|nr:hypothetical protein L1987_36569 [Smallanthus sonchifolius]